MTASKNPSEPVPELFDATDDVLDKSDTVVPILPGRMGRRFMLESRQHRLELKPGSLLIGRSGACQLVLEDSLVSRRHALVVVKADSVRIKDLDSANGVYVNGKRIEDVVTLRPGDRVAIGQSEMVLRVLETDARGSGEPFLADTLTGLQPLAFGRPGEEEGEQTQQGQALELLGGLADKVLVLGRGEEAERILLPCLSSLLKRSKSPETLEADTVERAANYAMKLATATGKGRWVDYCFELYTVLRRPLPGPIVEQLYKELRNISGINLGLLRDYVAALRAVQARFGPTDRFLVHRIQGLERLLR